MCSPCLEEFEGGLSGKPLCSQGGGLQALPCVAAPFIPDSKGHLSALHPDSCSAWGLHLALLRKGSSCTVVEPVASLSLERQGQLWIWIQSGDRLSLASWWVARAGSSICSGGFLSVLNTDLPLGLSLSSLVAWHSVPVQSTHLYHSATGCEPHNLFPALYFLG